jgi:NAD(P)-dependent dehydrogenase (short-subunit alcohol dehydrogenase family)
MHASKVALVTGGTRGIGRAVVLRLAAAGASIATLYHRDEEAAAALSEELTALGAPHLVSRCDVRDFEALRRFSGEVLARFGRIDYLVNNVGIDIFQRVEEVSFEQWREAQDVMLNAPFVLTREILPGMRARHFGRIVMIGASSRDYEKGAAGLAPYGVHKTALKVLVRTLAMEAIGAGITVNMVAPGSTSDAGTIPEERRIPVSSIPLGRRVLPDEIAAAVGYFLSAEAGATTGQCLNVNGGLAT